jgi:hypothetical protein
MNISGLKNDRQYNGQKKKKQKGEQYLQNVHKENNRLGKTNPTKNSDAPEV